MAKEIVEMGGKRKNRVEIMVSWFLPGGKDTNVPLNRNFQVQNAFSFLIALK